jgi:hypothetical protein
VNNKNKKKKINWPKIPLIKPRASHDSKNRAEDILKLIRSRDRDRNPKRFTVPVWEEGHGIWRSRKTKPIELRGMTADTWQKFKRDFIAEYDGEEVKETGFTDSEFLVWFKDGKRELHSPMSKIEALLAELHAHDEATEGDADEEK